MKYLLLLIASLAFNVNAGLVQATYNGLPDSGDSLFTVTDANNNLDDSNFELNLLYGGFNTNDHEFGIFHYDLIGQNVVSTLKIFDSTNTAGDDTNVVWDLNNQQAASTHGIIDLSLAAGLNFGAYFRSDNRMYYSLATLNAGEHDAFGLYWETDPFKNANLHLTAHDNGYGRSLDLLEVSISDVGRVDLNGSSTDVPEPNMFLLMGLALCGIAVAKRKRNA